MLPILTEEKYKLICYRRRTLLVKSTKGGGNKPLLIAPGKSRFRDRKITLSRFRERVKTCTVICWARIKGSWKIIESEENGDVHRIPQQIFSMPGKLRKTIDIFSRTVLVVKLTTEVSKCLLQSLPTIFASMQLPSHNLNKQFISTIDHMLLHYPASFPH